jgi:plasmid stabilization system protein ParE
MSSWPRPTRSCAGREGPLHANGSGAIPAALALRRKAAAALSRLADFPDSGHSLPEFPELPFREVIVAPYRFFYRVKADTVWIVAVWHGAQLPDEPGVERG